MILIQNSYGYYSKKNPKTDINYWCDNIKELTLMKGIILYDVLKYQVETLP